MNRKTTLLALACTAILAAAAPPQPNIKPEARTKPTENRQQRRRREREEARRT